MNRLFTYLRQSRIELGKVVWPTRQQAIRLTVAVIIFTLVLAAFIGGIDYLLAKGLEALILR